MSRKLVAYHNDPALKERVMEKIAQHRRADEIRQGHYYLKMGERLKVCAVGCLLHDPSGGHERYESEFGIPEELAYIEDRIFESMHITNAKAWPERFMGAIFPGTDLTNVVGEYRRWRADVGDVAAYKRADKLVELLEAAPCADGTRKVEA